ncbi:helix-turn-helix domain-containing protein [Endozoicomonas sp. Mp262]|uniref:helix-turn-helix domain-containing protein n=1 Tax=Endozoicomonas sp. Mp262 TaxID=2919499 RepID=UPI0021DAC86A
MSYHSLRKVAVFSCGQYETFTLTDVAVIKTLREAIRHGPYPYLRERAHAILLSIRGYSMSEIAAIFEVRYQTVSDWIDAWDDYGLRGLYKKHEGGKPPAIPVTSIKSLQQQGLQ